MSTYKFFVFISEIGDFKEIWFNYREIMKFIDFLHFNEDIIRLTNMPMDEYSYSQKIKCTIQNVLGIKEGLDLLLCYIHSE